MQTLQFAAQNLLQDFLLQTLQTKFENLATLVYKLYMQIYL